MAARDGAIEIFLQPGEFFVGDAAFRVRTLLGSCVSMTLWHRQYRVGAMSHFLLPSRPPVRAGTPEPGLDARYGDDALALMLDELARMGVRGGDCEAKVFGGGYMFQRTGGAAERVGERNGVAARRLLAVAGIPVLSQSLFGNGYRQIIFDVGTGDVWERQPGQPEAAGCARPPVPSPRWGKTP
jgi:chemotaxis protein CheD